MRNRCVGDRIDFLDLKHAKVIEPTVKREQVVMFGAEVLWRWLAGNHAVERPAYGYTVNVFTLNVETDDAAGE
jgi:hypothetical protein